MFKGKDLKVLRLLHNVTTQKQLAELTGFTERTIAEVESKDKPLSDKLFREVQARLNVAKYEEIKHQFFDLSGEVKETKTN